MRPLPIDDALHQLLHSYHRAMRQACREAGLELPVSHLRTLKIIGHFQTRTGTPCTSHAIATRLERDKAQIARVIKELLNDGLIEKRHNPDDRRSHFLTLTEAGTATLACIRQAERQAGARLSRGLSPEELDSFSRLSQIMIRNLNSDPTPETP